MASGGAGAGASKVKALAEKLASAAMDEGKTFSLDIAKDAIAHLTTQVEVAKTSSSKLDSLVAAITQLQTAQSASFAALAGAIEASAAEQKHASRMAMLQAAISCCQDGNGSSFKCVLDVDGVLVHGESHRVYCEIFQAAIKGFDGCYVDASLGGRFSEAGRVAFNEKLVDAVWGLTGMKGRVAKQADGRWCFYFV